jgi:hypothetical protein
MTFFSLFFLFLFFFFSFLFVSLPLFFFFLKTARGKGIQSGGPDYTPSVSSPTHIRIHPHTPRSVLRGLS